jgi:hypothetical protein
MELKVTQKKKLDVSLVKYSLQTALCSDINKTLNPTVVAKFNH